MGPDVCPRLSARMDVLALHSVLHLTGLSATSTRTVSSSSYLASRSYIAHHDFIENRFCVYLLRVIEGIVYNILAVSTTLVLDPHVYLWGFHHLGWNVERLQIRAFRKNRKNRQGRIAVEYLGRVPRSLIPCSLPRCTYRSIPHLFVVDYLIPR